MSSYSKATPYPRDAAPDGLLPLLPLNSQAQRKSNLKPSKSVRAKRTIKAIVSPIKTRREKKAYKIEARAREEAERVANIEDFLACGRIYYEKQCQNGMYDPFSDSRKIEY